MSDTEKRLERHSERVRETAKSVSETQNELMQFQAAVMTQFAKAEEADRARDERMKALEGVNQKQTETLTKVDGQTSNVAKTPLLTVLAMLLVEALRYWLSLRGVR